MRAGLQTAAEVSARFWSKVEQIPFHSCWEWVGHKDKDGYGRVRINKVDHRSHRVSWEWANGRKLRVDELVCHKCDNPSCVNPAHLFVGTARDNTQDMIRKGRHSGFYFERLPEGLIRYRSNLAKRTHCKFGHEFNEKNTYWVTPRKRRCRICSAKQQDDWRVRHGK